MQTTNSVNSQGNNSIGAVLAEFELFKENYANDSLVQAMASQLQRLQAVAQLDESAILAMSKDAGLRWIPRTEPDDAYMGVDEVFKDVTMPQMQKLLMLAGCTSVQHLNIASEQAVTLLCEVAGLTWVPAPDDDDICQESGDEFVGATMSRMRDVIALSKCAVENVAVVLPSIADADPSAVIRAKLGAAWDQYREDKPLPAADAFLFAAGFLAGCRPNVDGSVIESSDRERLLYAARVLRAIGDHSPTELLGELWSEAVVAVGTMKRVLNISDEQSIELGLTAKSMAVPGPDGKLPESPLLKGWLEAAIAWEVCASIHRQYAKGKDALFTTRQGDFVRHAEDARRTYKTIVGAAG